MMRTPRISLYAVTIGLLSSSGCSVLPKQQAPLAMADIKNDIAAAVRAELSAAIDAVVQAGLVNLTKSVETTQEAEAGRDLTQVANDVSMLKTMIRTQAIREICGYVLIGAALLLGWWWFGYHKGNWRAKKRSMGDL